MSSLWASRLAYVQYPGLWHEVEWSWREGDPEIMPAELRAALRKEEAAVVDEFPSGHHRILFGRDEWINYLDSVCDPPRGACWKKRPDGSLASGGGRCGFPRPVAGLQAPSAWPAGPAARRRPAPRPLPR
ncbi:unnamed protein product, partial [Prorocentrum cordatum]